MKRIKHLHTRIMWTLAITAMNILTAWSTAIAIEEVFLMGVTVWIVGAVTLVLIGTAFSHLLRWFITLVRDIQELRLQRRITK